MSLYECTLETCPIEDSIYEYQPSIAANACFIAFFAITGIAHVVQGIITKKRAFWIAVALGCVAEVVGYVGRVLSHFNPFEQNGFLIQICCLTIAPAFFAAGIYFTLGDIVTVVSPRSSRIKPSGYAAIFIPSVSSQNNEDPAVGTHVMVAGLSFQVASMFLFILLAMEYAWRVRRIERDAGRLPLSKIKLQLFVTFFSLAVISIFIRCIYRVIELSEGWEGSLIKNETIFIVLEGVMVLLAVYAMHIGHPGFLGRVKKETSPSMVEQAKN